jgi:hypothetical protein
MLPLGNRNEGENASLIIHAHAMPGKKRGRLGEGEIGSRNV